MCDDGVLCFYRKYNWLFHLKASGRYFSAFEAKDRSTSGCDPSNTSSFSLQNMQTLRKIISHPYFPNQYTSILSLILTVGSGRNNTPGTPKKIIYRTSCTRGSDRPTNPVNESTVKIFIYFYRLLVNICPSRSSFMYLFCF